VKAHFDGGKISCVEYWDFAGNCRQIGQGLGAARQDAPPQTVRRPYNAFGYYQQQQQQENNRENQMYENNSHLAQPLDRGDSNYERVNGNAD
jgi:hypothetical protein